MFYFCPKIELIVLTLVDEAYYSKAVFSYDNVSSGNEETHLIPAAVDSHIRCG